MKLAKLIPIRKLFASCLALALAGSGLSGIAGNAAYADAGFTPPQAVYDHLAKDDWSILQSILSGIYGSVTTPLKIHDLNQGKYTTGQIVGNGDIGATAAGVSTTSQQFYFGKNDFWGTLHAQGNAVKDNQGILSGGGLDIWPTTAPGSNAASVFNMKQDILNAQITTTIQVKSNEGSDATVQMNSWTADSDNVFVTEITNTGTGAVTLNTKLWVPAMAYRNSSAADLTDANSTYPYTGGIDESGDNPVLWTTRDSNAGSDGNTSKFRSRMATATTVVGAELFNTQEKIEANDYYDSNKGKYYNSLGEAGDFTIEADSSVYLVTYITSSSGHYQEIKSVADVQKDAISGIAAYTTKESIDELKADHLQWWKDYWLKSYSQLNDPELNKYYFSSLYILGSSNRPTSPNGKVNPQNLPGSMYGPWIPADNVGWGGRYFLNYNQQAQYYAAGSANRIETAVPFNRVIAYDLPWQINNAKGQGYDGAVHVRTLSPFHLMSNDQPSPASKSSTKTYGFNASSTDQKSNGYFAAIVMMFYYEYTLDEEYLRTVLYPHLKELLTFYDQYVLKIDDGNGQYHYSVIGSSIHEGDAADINPDLDIGAIKFMANFLSMHAHKMNEQQASLDRWKDLADHTHFPEAMLPKGIFNAGNNSNFVPTILAVDYMSPNQAHVDLIEPGDQPVELEGVVFPFENAQMLDGDKELLQKVRNTLEYMNGWAAAGFAGWNSQNNGFTKVYPIAAKAGWPAADLLNKFKTALKAKLRNSNLTYYASGGGNETIGALEGLHSMLLQSSTTPDVPSTIWAFPNWDRSRSATFERLGAKGNIEVSSAYDANTETIPYVDINSRRDGRVALVNPWTAGEPVIQLVNGDNTLGAEVEYVIKGGKIIFEASKDTRYMVMNDYSAPGRHVSDISLDRYSATLVYNGKNGTDTTAVTATLSGNPDDAVIWTSSDERIVAVAGDGRTAALKAVGTGTGKVANVTVTATSAQDEGVSETIKVKVADASTVPASLTMVSPAAATIYGPASTGASTGKVTGTNRLQLTVSMKPDNAYDKRLLWTSSDQNIAMVDKNGLVIARGHGTATITGTSMANPALSVEAKVTVTAQGADHSGDSTLAAVLNAAKGISEYAGDRTAGGGFTRKSSSPNWEPMQERFQMAQINALGVKSKYSGYSTTNISEDTAFFAAVALNEAIKAIDPSLALVVSRVDRSELAAAITTAEQYTADNFDTPEDWAELQAALAAAKAVHADAEAVQEAVDHAANALRKAIGKVANIPVKTITLGHVGMGTSSTNTSHSGYMEYHLDAVGLDLNTNASLRPAPTNRTTLTATVAPAMAPDKSLIWTATDIIGSNVVALGEPQTGDKAKLTMLTSTSTAQGIAPKQFDSLVTVTANAAGVALVTATNPDSGVSANYIVTVSDQATVYVEAEIRNNPNASYIGSSAGTDKATSGSTSSGGALAGNLTNVKGLQIAKIDGGEHGGEHNLVVYYATTTERNTAMRSLAVTVNGHTYKFLTHGHSFNYDFPELVPIMVTVPLQPGDNTIQLFGDSSLASNVNAPNIDKAGIAPASDYTAVAANTIAVTGDATTVTATVAASTTTGLNKVRDSVTYQVYRDGIPVGEPVPARENMLTPGSGVTYQYDAEGANIIPAGIGLALRKYDAVIQRKDYNAAGVYTVKFTASDGTNRYESNETKLFAIAGDATPGAVLTGVDQVYAGQSFELTYGLNGVSGEVLAQDITLSYDADKLDFISAASLDDDSFKIAGIHETAGEIRLLGVHLGALQADPNTDLLRLTFNAKQGSESPGTVIADIAVTSLIAADRQGDETSLGGAAHRIAIHAVQKDGLIELIALAQEEHDLATEGKGIGQYPAGAKAALQEAIDRAQAVVDDSNATLAQIGQAAIELNAALQAFRSSAITEIPGDNNNDGKVSIGDLAIVAKVYGKKKGDAGWDDVKRYDLNGDGVIDIADLSALARMILEW